ncbi:hypothetical protein G6F31_021007 [Rhizopus arrhizus]|nr:hypothetical protein G6F31_021007 [Rhizopus arrhizus]
MDGREEEVVAVGLGLGRELRTDDPARARLVVHHGRHRPQLSKRLRGETRGRVHRTAGGKRHDEGHGVPGPRGGAGGGRKQVS